MQLNEVKKIDLIFSEEEIKNFEETKRILQEVITSLKQHQCCYLDCLDDDYGQITFDGDDISDMIRDLSLLSLDRVWEMY